MIDWLVPHQANKRIIEATADRMGLPMDKVMVTIHKYGNTTDATIPLCLWDYEAEAESAATAWCSPRSAAASPGPASSAVGL